MRNRLSFYCTVAFLVTLASCSVPKSSFDFSGPERPAPVAKVEFKNTSKGALDYFWDFGDSTTSTEAEPEHSYRESGNYEVKLTAKKGAKSNISTKTIQVSAPKNCTVLLETEHGTMTIQLYDATPLHRDNFIKLAEEGFFDGLLFHRVMNGFMIQGGDPDSRDARPNQHLGMGGPGYTIPAEFVDTLAHIKGALAAARQPDQVNPEKRSSGSQFYIVQGKPWTEEQLSQIERMRNIKYSDETRKMYMEVGGTAHLDQDYTIFGRVVDGLDVVDKIAALETNGDPPRGTSRPLQDVKIKVKVVY